MGSNPASPTGGTRGTLKVFSASVRMSEPQVRLDIRIPEHRGLVEFGSGAITNVEPVDNFACPKSSR